MSDKTKLNRAISASILIIVSVLVSFASIEGLLRLKNNAQNVYDIEMWRYSNTLKRKSDNPILGHEHIPSKKAVLQNTEIRINAIGLRGSDLPPPRASQRRILFLGSSATLGWGVREEETLTRLLQKMFKDTKQDVLVMNAGIGNYNAVRYVERFLKKLKITSPTDIVVHYFVNDAEILKTGGGNFLLRHSQLAVTLWVVIQRLTGEGGLTSLEDHYRSIYQSDSPGFKTMVSALTKLKRYADKNNIKLYLAMTPDIHSLQNYRFDFIHNKMKKVSHEIGYRYIDLLPALRNIPSEKIWAMPGDPHPNYLGHEIMAKTIFPIIK